jgi:hypothetical protein
MAHLTGAVGYAQQTSITVGSSAPTTALGTRARDAAGNEYVYVDFGAAFVEGEVVAISTAYSATECVAATVGMVGLALGTQSSDTCGWVQIYGTGSALGTSLLVIGPVGLDATSLGISFVVPQTTGVNAILGMYCTLGSTATSATWTSADMSSAIGGLVTVQLNYPFANGLHVESAVSS